MCVGVFALTSKKKEIFVGNSEKNCGKGRIMMNPTNYIYLRTENYQRKFKENHPRIRTNVKL